MGNKTNGKSVRDFRILKRIILTKVFILISIFCMTMSGYAHDRVRDLSVFNPSADFTLTDHNGKTFHLKDHRGKKVMLFFGYISCPDVCPVTFSKLSRVYQQMTPAEREQILTLFISVDPDRDTQALLKEYLEYFDVNAIGLTGSVFDVNDVVDLYKGFYEKVGTKSAMGYLINHTSYVYLLDEAGKTHYLFRPEDSVDHYLEIIRKIKK